jgi:hypothetical protein
VFLRAGGGGLYRFFRRLFSLRTTRPSWAPQGSRSSSLFGWRNVADRLQQSAPSTCQIS